MRTLNTKIVVLTLFILLLANPFQVVSGRQYLDRHPERQQVSCKQAAEAWEVLFAVTAFGFGVTPGMQGLAVVWGGLALGAKVYGAVACGGNERPAPR